MAIATLRLGPTDSGRAMTLREYLDAEVEPGYRYELASSSRSPTSGRGRRTDPRGVRPMPSPRGSGRTSSRVIAADSPQRVAASASVSSIARWNRAGST
jgi:hypothetical protein